MQRGKDKAYVITPVSKGDMYFNTEMIDKIKRSIQEAKENLTQQATTPKGVRDLLGL